MQGETQTSEVCWTRLKSAHWTPNWAAASEQPTLVAIAAPGAKVASARVRRTSRVGQRLARGPRQATDLVHFKMCLRLDPTKTKSPIGAVQSPLQKSLQAFTVLSVQISCFALRCFDCSRHLKIVELVQSQVCKRLFRASFVAATPFCDSVML